MKKVFEGPGCALGSSMLAPPSANTNLDSLGDFDALQGFFLDGLLTDSDTMYGQANILHARSAVALDESCEMH